MVATFYDLHETPRCGAAAAFPLNITLSEPSSRDVYRKNHVEKRNCTEIEKSKRKR